MNSLVKLNQQQLIKKIKEVPAGRVYRLDYFSKKEGKVVSRLAKNGVKKFLKGDPTYKKPEGTYTYYDCTKQNYRGPKLENLKGFKYKNIEFKAQ